MDNARRQLIGLYLSNLQVHVSELGFNPVGGNWKDIDYRPDYNKFYLICEGEGWIKVGDQELYPKPGQLALMTENTVQSFSTISDNYYTKYWCHFSAKIGSLNLFDLIRLPLILDVHEDEVPTMLFKEMLQHWNSPELSASLHLKSCILRLIGYYLDRSASVRIQTAHSESAEILKTTLAYINDNYHRNIKVVELAEMMHMHPNYFIRLFKKHLGTSPIQYVNRIRIEQVKLLLISSSLTLSEIGDQVGIPDISYLSKLFKAATGFSPTAYKESQLAGLL